MRLSPILALILIALRGVHGIDFGFYLSLVVYSIFSFILWFMYPWFLKLTSKYRILLSAGITLFISGGILVLALSVASSDKMLDLFFAYIIVPPLGVAMISYIIEMIENNILLQQLLVKAEKMEAVEQMGAAISHEIRNPLTTSIGFIELLDKDSLNQEKRNQYLSILKNELDSAERIIQDYLAYSKPVISSVEALNVQKELTLVINLLQPLANYYSVKVSTNLLSTKLMEGDRSKFHQCFINIIKYFIECMPNGGALLIETVDTGTNIMISIQNTDERRNEEQLKMTSHGMTVAFNIVRAMKGTIDVINKFGKETVIQFTFKPIKAHLK
ncbi:histidine kinase dimerization/phospho-acceptor domain-containing protein [Psychrobacillus sp. L3]|uniref:histidine kinase dimerization/phospho-acceptor domain-containing protein n=1 Tax=Psychrobacillus sp. L3 TaxID=3236891 RepID=UPI0036F1EB63